MARSRWGHAGRRREQAGSSRRLEAANATVRLHSGLHGDDRGDCALVVDGRVVASRREAESGLLPSSQRGSRSWKARQAWLRQRRVVESRAAEGRHGARAGKNAARRGSGDDEHSSARGRLGKREWGRRVCGRMRASRGGEAGRSDGGRGCQSLPISGEGRRARARGLWDGLSGRRAVWWWRASDRQDMAGVTVGETALRA